jgi:tetratricopeptide (TPR) repeat protein
MHRSLELVRQAQVLSPSRLDVYTLQLAWHRLNRDEEALHDLAERLRRVPNLDTSSYSRMRKTYIAGGDHVQRVEEAENSVSRAAGRIENALRGGHQPTAAAALFLKGSALISRAELDMRYESAMEAVTAFREAEHMWPSVSAQQGLGEALLLSALLKVAEHNDTLRQTWKVEARRFGWNLIIHRLLEAGDAASIRVLQAQQELAESVVLRKQAPDESLGLSDWIVGRLTAETDLEARGHIAMSRAYLVKLDEIELILYASSEAAKLRLELRRGA